MEKDVTMTTGREKVSRRVNDPFGYGYVYMHEWLGYHCHHHPYVSSRSSNSKQRPISSSLVGVASRSAEGVPNGRRALQAEPR